MEEILRSNAEQKALEALKLTSFRSLNLYGVKDSVTKILGLIGRNEIFDQYTKHDISHINDLLESVDWIIPDSTKKIMTSADWLMLVLAIYFHDLGMLVTKDEYIKRYDSAFTSFKQKVINGQYGLDYKKKIFDLGEEQSERFLYQEFVRSKHAERVKFWIEGEDNLMLGHSNQIVKELKKLIGELHPAFKRDLGLICESHHLDDLDNFSKYKTNYSYGSSKDEQVNLQYIAIILRTTDLLHITSSRTPSVEFNLINPSDPISQNEWYKQMAVSAVKAKPKRNSEGEIDHSLVKDTIEVTAYFDKPEKADSFFGLIAYLGYVKMQLQKSFQWIQLANKIQGSRYEFNWRNIDDSLIETRGFEKKLFEFILDQTKILKLLVGHTLYNDITVVYREIIQNSIDAIRLQKMIKGEDHSYLGKVQISFNKENKELIIRDNGTGMTQEIIEKHLLNIGSSRYQDEIFVKRFPNFSPISRFGIGILTLFLISDDIQIITCSEDEDFAKLLRLKKVEGKYLLQHLKKYELNNFISVHGTEIKIKVREGINLSQIENDIKKWILFPSCEVEYIVGEQVKKIGYSSPKEALEVFFKGRDYSYGDRIEIREEVRNGLTLAYAIVEDSFTGSSSLMEASEETTYAIRNHPIGLCIEGIRVQDTTPGYKGLKFFATANFSGSNGPKTNVARSLIEDNNEKQMLLKTIYQIYADFIKSKIAELFL